MVAVLVLFVPAYALACPACGGGATEDTRAAYILTTIILSLLPLGFVFGVIAWLRFRTKHPLEV